LETFGLIEFLAWKGTLKLIPLRVGFLYKLETKELENPKIRIKVEGNYHLNLWGPNLLVNLVNFPFGLNWVAIPFGMPGKVAKF